MICVSIQETNIERCRQILAECDMVELRGDLCTSNREFTIDILSDLVRSHPNLLYTHRLSPSSTDIDIPQKYMCAAIKAGAKYVDIEIEAPMDYLEMIREYAKANCTKFIISYHNFTCTPSLEELKSIYEISIRKGADIVKIVTTAQNHEDGERVLSLYNNINQIPLVAFAMGEVGRFTRHQCIEKGAPYTYAAYDSLSATAAGQYTLKEMKEFIDNKNSYK